MASTTARELEPGGAAFYGVRPGWLHLWEQAKREARDWFYLDNSFVDAGREAYFRVGVNATQSWSTRPSDGKRLAQLGVRVQPWRRTGSHIVVCLQSEDYMRPVANWPSGVLGWQEHVLRALRPHTDRLIVVRGKKADRPLAQELGEAWLLVAHSSAAAVEALIAGVPVIVTDPACAASGFSSAFEAVESPRRPDGREEWAARLADSQWTSSEMRDGMAWRAIWQRAG